MGFNDFNCTAIHDINGFHEVTNCLVGQVFGADYLIVGIILVACVAFLVWRSRLTLSSVLPISTVLSYALANISPVFWALFLLSIVANGIFLVLGVFSLANK